jgi:uncharacterized membrane protein YfcA
VPELDAIQWTLAVVVGLFLGFTKTGVAGMNILVVPLMAMIFPARESVGALLPMLIVGDIVAVGYYHRHAVWRHVLPLLPWVMAGMPLGFLALKHLDNETMKVVLGVLVLSLIGLRVVRGRFGEWLDRTLPSAWWFIALVGLLAGFATGLANAAGSIMSVYLLTQGLPKKEFVGTGAVFYMIVNLVKLPVYTWLGIVTAGSLTLNGCLVPAILVGAVLGILLLPRIPQRLFNWLIIILAAAASIRMMLS